MVAIYSKEKALEIIRLLKSCEIVTLNIFLDNASDSFKENTEYILNYTVIDDYPDLQKEEIRKKININSTGYFVKAVKEVDEFIEMMESNKVKGYALSFNIKVNKLKVNKAYKATDPKEDLNDFHGLISKLESFIKDSGKQDNKISVYNKVPNPNGKRPKYEQMSLREVIDILKNMEA
jgi:hypothetical protein